MKTLEEWIAIDESKEDDYTGATSMLGTVKNIVWQMLKNSRHGNRLAKANNWEFVDFTWTGSEADERGGRHGETLWMRSGTMTQATSDG